MEFTRYHLQLISVALSRYAQVLRKDGEEVIANDNLALARMIDNYLLETALPATRKLNRDEADPEQIWA